MRFEWDPRKAAKNVQKHRVSFEEAETVFYDENALVLEDPGPSDQEERFVIIGLSAHVRILTVCHCLRHEDTVRIISARKADREETEDYQRRLTR